MTWYKWDNTDPLLTKSIKSEKYTPFNEKKNICLFVLINQIIKFKRNWVWDSHATIFSSISMFNGASLEFRVSGISNDIRKISVVLPDSIYWVFGGPVAE